MSDGWRLCCVTKSNSPCTGTTEILFYEIIGLITLNITATWVGTGPAQAFTRPWAEFDLDPAPWTLPPQQQARGLRSKSASYWRKKRKVETQYLLYYLRIYRMLKLWFFFRRHRRAWNATKNVAKLTNLIYPFVQVISCSIFYGT